MTDIKETEIKKLKELRDQSVENYVVAKANAKINKLVMAHVKKELYVLGYREEDEEKESERRKPIGV